MSIIKDLRNIKSDFLYHIMPNREQRNEVFSTTIRFGHPNNVFMELFTTGSSKYASGVRN